MSQPLLGAAGHTCGQPGRIGGFFQLEGIPVGKRLGDLGEVRRHIQETAPLGRLVRIHRGGHHGAPVAGAVRNQRERVVQQQRDRRKFAGQRGLPRIAGVDVMHGLAQIQVQILARAATVAMHGGRRHGIAHHRDANRRGQPVTGRDDRILTGKRHPPPGIGNRQSDVGQQVVERRGRIELGSGLSNDIVSFIDELPSKRWIGRGVSAGMACQPSERVPKMTESGRNRPSGAGYPRLRGCVAAQSWHCPRCSEAGSCRVARPHNGQHRCGTGVRPSPTPTSNSATSSMR